MKKTILIVSLVVLSIVGSFYTGWRLNSYAQNTAATQATDAAGIYIENLLRGKPELAYNVTTDGFKKDFTLANFKTQAEGAINSDPNFISTYTAKVGNGYVVYSTIDGFTKDQDDNTSRLFTVSVVKDGGKYKVDSAISQ